MSKRRKSYPSESHQKGDVRIVISAKQLTEHPLYRSIERLAGLMFADEILKHNHQAKIEGGQCSCGYEMNWYDLLAYSILRGIHTREKAKEVLDTKPQIIGSVEMEVNCLECGGPLTITGEWLCAWRVVDEQFGDTVNQIKFGQATG